MHSYRRDIALFLLLSLVIFIIVAAGPTIAQLTVARLDRMVADTWAEASAMAGLVRVAAPRLAVLLSEALIAGGALVVLSFISLIFVVPWGLYSLHQKFDSLQSELYALRLQMAAMSLPGKSQKSAYIPSPIDEASLQPQGPNSA